MKIGLKWGVGRGLERWRLARIRLKTASGEGS